VTVEHSPAGTISARDPGHLHPALLSAVRLGVAAVWIYEGLWLKMLYPSPHELAVMRAVTVGSLSPTTLLFLIGCGELLLGLGVLSSVHPRFLAWFQGVILVLMNALGIAFTGKAIADPAGLVVHNLPFLLCILILGVHAPAPSTRPSAGEKR
jgi:uncharacterized membrane protein YphA (DoxX/SURF4 family)